ncbi:uncharacterized protein BT62DRAFT_1080677 [Guyanagaster necrorhizus]|uniref:Uncharacterized protein n=1 Tax=Guyanagaster necrorhizus TaxID=856835 RepID=A0A9P7VHH0_9AGAR|nr:uncharacterized protein BT62DRAFT_1080677 [Guyanagaster necrorhizus MCA 3950]KAG7440663.1 hypothetical protein BT62DRAFT_1080677 [Guyanagaster necrorhizus MCA 3950]
MCEQATSLAQWKRCLAVPSSWKKYVRGSDTCKQAGLPRVLPDVVRTTSIHSEQTKEGFITLERQSLPLFLREDAGSLYDRRPSVPSPTLAATKAYRATFNRPSSRPFESLERQVICAASFLGSACAISSTSHILLYFLDAVSDEANSYKYDLI